MQVRVRFLALIMAMAAAVAMGHGEQKHVSGTVAKISVDAVMVKTVGGKTVEVKLVSKTTYAHKDGKAAQLSELAVGDRVVIHAMSRGDALEAAEVKFTKPANAAHAHAKSKP